MVTGGSVASCVTPGAAFAVDGANTFARPKSSSFAPVLVNMMLAGLRSRCVMWARCVRSIAPATSRPMRRTSSSGSGRLVASRAASVCPSRHGITRYSMPSRSPTSYTLQMCGSSRAAMARASRSKRARRSASALPAMCGATTLRATVRPRRTSRARYTSPMPPDPRWPRISYEPTRSPGARRMALAQVGARMRRRPRAMSPLLPHLRCRVPAGMPMMVHPGRLGSAGNPRTGGRFSAPSPSR